ncbi:MAG: hypothetical protein ACYDH2_05410 [Anaerolineaceae bacterium]
MLTRTPEAQSGIRKDYIGKSDPENKWPALYKTGLQPIESAA